MLLEWKSTSKKVRKDAFVICLFVYVQDGSKKLYVIRSIMMELL